MKSTSCHKLKKVTSDVKKTNVNLKSKTFLNKSEIKTVYLSRAQHWALHTHTLTVRGGFKLIRQFRDVDFKAILNGIQDLCVVFFRHKRYGQALGTKATRSSNLITHTDTHISTNPQHFSCVCDSPCEGRCQNSQACHS